MLASKPATLANLRRRGKPASPFWFLGKIFTAKDAEGTKELGKPVYPSIQLNPFPTLIFSKKIHRKERQDRKGTLGWKQSSDEKDVGIGWDVFWRNDFLFFLRPLRPLR
jgi:hypothetical protein